jgi:hypothetical protein
MNSQTDPQLQIIISSSIGSIYKKYIITPDTPEQVIDLTADLAEARPKEEIVSTMFPIIDFDASSEKFYQHCINVLSNVFILHTYDE